MTVTPEKVVWHRDGTASINGKVWAVWEKSATGGYDVYAYDDRWQKSAGINALPRRLADDYVREIASAYSQT